jgi:hypothetical protein
MRRRLGAHPRRGRAWTNRWFTVGGRIYYSLLAVTAPVLLWWVNYWNPFGFRFWGDEDESWLESR